MSTSGSPSASSAATTPTTTDFEHARVVILPVPLDRTTSYVPGTRNGPHEILVASSHMELWDEETETDVHSIGIFTLPEMEFPFATHGRGDRGDSPRRVGTRLARQVSGRPRRRAFDYGAGRRRRWRRSTRGLSVLQIDAHADLRDSYMGTPHNHACAMRRVLEHARTTQVGIRSLSPEEAAAVPTLPTEIFYDFNMRRHEDWIERVVESLGETVYITIDCDGFDPAIMPAVGTPEPGGLTWYEALALLRRVIESRRVVGCDIVELCPAARQRRAEFPLREADLQDSVVSVWSRGRAPGLKSSTTEDTEEMW